MKLNYINGDLIKMAKSGKFDVIAHGCNCFCTMRSGIAPQMAKAFGCDEYLLEKESFRGDINKLGCIEYSTYNNGINVGVSVVNAYTQYRYGKNHKDGTSKPLDYAALILCFRKMNTIFKGKHIGLPKIGAGLAGGDWNRIEKIIKQEFKDCTVTIVNYTQ